MLCDVCKKHEATVHVTGIINGQKQETNMCEACAAKEGINFPGEMDFTTPFSFQNLFTGFIDYISGEGDETLSKEPSCQQCGMTLSEFKRYGLLGCSECYEQLKDSINPVIKRVQGNGEHVGKIPGKCGKVLNEKKKLLKLKEDLQKAITLEEYEEAAKIRDQIKELQRGEVQ